MQQTILRLKHPAMWVSQNQERDALPHHDLMSQIKARIEASKQFTIVVVGIGIANCVNEQLSYNRGAKIFGEFPDSIISLTALVVFLIYASRFFFNFWIELSEVYSDDRMGSLEEKDLNVVLKSSRLEMFYSIYLGITTCVVSMLIQQDRSVPLTILIAIHLIVDSTSSIFGIIKSRSAFSHSQDQFGGGFARPLNRTIGWTINNSVFAGVFLVLLGIVLRGGADRATYIAIVAFWLANSVAAIGVALRFRS